MTYLNFKSRYDKYPETEVDGYDEQAWKGYGEILKTLASAMLGKKVLTVDCYPGVDDTEVLTALKNGMHFSEIIESKDVFYDEKTLDALMARNLTDDRVRGIMYYGEVSDFIDQDKLIKMRERVKKAQGSVLVFGFAAALISEGDIFVYADMARWEIQLRYRKGMPNFKADNEKEDPLRKYKRGFFIEWRIADRHKEKFYDSMDFYLDTNVKGDPKMITGSAFTAGLRKVAKGPFRLVPYFDPGVWGGHWMQEVCGLDKDVPNYAWSFDGVPEENSLYLRYGDIRVETPAMNLTKYLPREFLGQKTFARFGAEFPIRFDMLDTMDGQNLSLQVHPLTEYIKTKFGMPYTQDESYYILDAKEDGGVYLGVKNGVDPQAMIADLEHAQNGEFKFPADKYVNLFPAKKHDHFLIPAGTVHCSSKNSMVLEISATPYIFTFKLWDWDRVDLNGIPRPIHIEDGKKVIQFGRDTDWVKENLINRFETISQNEDYTQVKTGLHELEFIETNVYASKKSVKISSGGEFSILNLVDGQEAVIESPENKFVPFTVHYAETFILPAAAGDFIVRSVGGEPFKVIRANVRY